MQSFFKRAGSCFAIAMACQCVMAAQQDLYVASGGTNSVKRYDGVTGAYLGDFVAPNSGGLSAPQGCLFGPDGNLYVTGASNANVLRYNGTTGAFMGAFTSGASFGFGADMSFQGGSLFVSDFTNPGHVYKFNGTTGVLISNFASDNPLTPDGQTWDSSGNLLVSSFSGNSVRKYSSTGAFLGIFATLPSGGQALDNRFGSDGNFYVTDYNRGTVDQFNGTTGVYIKDFITGLGLTQGQTVGPDGNLYVGSYSGGFINEYNEHTGVLIKTFATGGGLVHPNDFTFGPAAVPEPVSLVVLGAGFLGLCRKRRAKSS